MATTTNTAGVITEKRPAQDLWKIVSIALCIIGLGIAGYLSWSEITQTETICPQTGGFNCDLVQHSVYSHIGPIPVGFIGVAGYLAILAVLLLENTIPFFAQRGKLLIFGMALIGILFSGYLTAIEAFVLHAWCIWCVGSAITMLIVFIVSFAQLWQTISAEPELAEEEE